MTKKEIKEIGFVYDKISDTYIYKYKNNNSVIVYSMIIPRSQIQLYKSTKEIVRALIDKFFLCATDETKEKIIIGIKEELNKY